MQSTQLNVPPELFNKQFHHVYAWLRDDTWLYIGFTSNILGRLGYHNIIGKVESVLLNDKILLWCFSEWLEGERYEHELITIHRPKYNKDFKRRELAADKLRKLLLRYA